MFYLNFNVNKSISNFILFQIILFIVKFNNYDKLKFIIQIFNYMPDYSGEQDKGSSNYKCVILLETIL